MFFIFFYLAGCGIGLNLPKHDSRFNSILNQFQQDAAFFGKNADTSKISVAFGNPRKEYELLGVIKLTKDLGNVDAICLMVPKDSNEIGKTFYRSMYGRHAGDRIIIVDQSFQRKTAEEIEILVYHELGHCALNLPHKEDQVIMSSVSNGTVLGIYRYFYLREMFLNNKNYPLFIYPLEAKDLDDNDNLELVYQVDYYSFGKRLKNELYFDHNKEKFLFLDDVVESSL
ncbi:MAG: hypothetical protein A2381_08180 [Bdellovibrionales bacterium RIFOXYB1_FULL_37_110]|nr:MAG: hypothetical protein A2181_04945 [Bdellovibrionales bacterium RIFOXYA1_FULL_38_20]OFZ52581.1 MAG: hypothetical protein A2417_00900 [Bdellovibrionales bacterium RIFOXYC1_FULL_37_79]OFZ55662.1 MAG: hypothetical protein A2328_00725 [Bdellovibrionales bacterium RIFOXYB2_FULL_36_6]OFZ59783.1 MAG: hypothetical protein A2381_08180 [Bdellovibrionales bacterium RIFOXYB1_FULL_37_110]OFZ65310.1 MAG: hypothetical protein A2577_04150 [Bdellovibrionales bacterium RIFOXYD1_FULL_36_51]